MEANFLDLRAGRAEGTWQPFGLKVADAAGTGSPEQRVKEQDRDGMDAEVLFAAMVAGPVFWRNISHDEVYKAVIRGYNDWLAEEYCAVAPDRLIGMGVIPITNVDDAIAEMAHCKKLGLKGVLMGAFPAPRATDAGGRQVLGRRGRYGHAGDRARPVLPHRGARYPADLQISERRPGNHAAAAPAVPRMAVQFRPGAVGQHRPAGVAGVFERHPKLKIFFAETRLGWVPFWLEHMDLWYQRHLGWAQEYLGFQPLKELPSHYVRNHVYFSVQYERVAVETPACRRRPHHVRHRLPAYRMRVA